MKTRNDLDMGLYYLWETLNNLMDSYKYPTDIVKELNNLISLIDRKVFGDIPDGYDVKYTKLILEQYLEK